GVLVGAEVREPKPTLKGLGRALEGLFGGEPPGPEMFIPDAQVLVIVPDVGEKSEILFATIRLALSTTENKIEPFTVGNRKGFKLKPGEGGLFGKKSVNRLSSNRVVPAGGAAADIERVALIKQDDVPAP